MSVTQNARQCKSDSADRLRAHDIEGGVLKMYDNGVGEARVGRIGCEAAFGQA